MKTLQYVFFSTVLVLVGLVLPSSLNAADNEASVTSDKSTNPVTGTVTEKKKTKKKRKNADGSTSTAESSETVKTKTDGTVEKSAESESATK